MHEVCLFDQDELEERAMAVVSQALSDTQQAFDSVAADYDRDNSRNTTLCWMRERTIEAIVSHVPPNRHILDLGCGPGTDEETLARRGYRVTAVDWSPAMVEETRKRMARLGLQNRVEVHHLGIQQLDRLPLGSFDAACSNFGPLNCVPDLARAATLIAARVRDGGVLVASVIGKICPWEIAVYASRLDWDRLRVRFIPAQVAVPLNGRTVWTTYYTPAEFERMFVAAGFARVSLRALGLFAPPPYLETFSMRHPRLVAGLRRFEDRVAEYPGLRQWGDHFLVVMRKESRGHLSQERRQTAAEDYRAG
jgi:ubiquinone/menaquinone biosynthesis C-methylase UbiE